MNYTYTWLDKAMRMPFVFCLVFYDLKFFKSQPKQKRPVNLELLEGNEIRAHRLRHIIALAVGMQGRDIIPLSQNSLKFGSHQFAPYSGLEQCENFR